MFCLLPTGICMFHLTRILKNARTDWGQNGYQLFVEIADNQDMLKDLKENKKC